MISSFTISVAAISYLLDLRLHCLSLLQNHSSLAFDRVSAFKDVNKMTLQNLATVFGPTLLRPAAKEEEKTSGELLVAGAREALTQVAVLQHLLSLRAKSTL